MKIYYIPPVDAIPASMFPTVVPSDLSGTLKARKTVYDAVYHAIYDVMVEKILPAIGRWIVSTFRNIFRILTPLSYIFCLVGGIAGLICGILGLKKGYLFAVKCIVFYTIMQLILWALSS